MLGLQVPNVALRVTHTSRDLFSPRARSYPPRPVIPLQDDEPSQEEHLQEEPPPKTPLEGSAKGSATSVAPASASVSKPQSASSQREEARESTSNYYLNLLDLFSAILMEFSPDL